MVESQPRLRPEGGASVPLRRPRPAARFPTCRPATTPRAFLLLLVWRVDGVSRYFDFAICLQGVVTFPWTLPLTKEETEAQGGGVTEAQGGGASVPSLPRTDEEVVEAGVTPRPAPPDPSQGSWWHLWEVALGKPRAARWAALGAGPGRTSVLRPPSDPPARRPKCHPKRSSRGPGRRGGGCLLTSDRISVASRHLRRPRLAWDGSVLSQP